MGTAGNDVIIAGALAPDGVTAAATLNALDTIDGGAGIDTLILDTTGDVNQALIGTIKNVENLTFVGSGTDIGKGAAIDISGFSSVFKLQQTTDTTVSVSNVAGQTLALDRVANNTTLTASLNATQTSATLSNNAAAGAATFSVSGIKLDSVNLQTDKTAGALTVTDTGNTTKTANITATGAAAVTINSTALETVKITGAGAVTLTATSLSKALDSSASTGGVTYATDLVAQQFTGGAGKDVVQFGATTKAQTLGAGDDIATISADLGVGGSIDGGDGVDTLQMTATLAATLDNDNKFNAKVSNFEQLSITAATNQVLNLSNLAGLNYVKAAGNGAGLTINNFTSGGTLEFTDNSTTTSVTVKDAATGTADIFNVKLSAAASFNAGTLTAADIETININSDDTAASPLQDGSVMQTMVLTADKATTVNVSGDAALDLTLTGSTKVATIDASANTAGLTVDLSVASGITLTGTAKADFITLGNLSVATGGEGKDSYILTTPTNGNTYATITDFSTGETIQLADKGDNANGAALGAKISLAGTGAFADYLAAASAADGSTDGVTKWFTYDNDTYVVHDISVETTYQNGADQIVKLSGVLDLSNATVSAAGILEFVAA